MGLLFQAGEATVSFRETWMEIKHRIEELLGSDKDRILIGIDGRAGSGKTTLQESLRKCLTAMCFKWMTSFCRDISGRKNEQRK